MVGGMGREYGVRGAIGWSLLRLAGARVVNTLAFLVLARLLTPADFGICALASVFIAGISVVQDQGLGEALVSVQELTDDRLNAAFWAAISIASVLGAAVAGTSHIWERGVGQHDLSPVMWALSASLLLSASEAVPRSLMVRALDFRALAIRDTCASIFGCVVGIVVALCGGGVWALVGQTLAVSAVGTAVLWRTTSWRPTAREWPKFGTLKPLLSISVNLLAIALMTFIMTRIDDLLVGAYLGAYALGLYAIAYQIYSIVGEFSIVSVSSTSLSSLSRATRVPEEFRTRLRESLNLTMQLAGPTFALLILAGPSVLDALFGAHWRAASGALRVLGVLGFWQAIWFVCQWALVARRRAGVVLIISAISALGSLAGFLACVRFGITAVAGSFVARGYIITMPVAVWALRRYLGISLRWLINAVSEGLGLAAATGTAVVAVSIVTGIFHASSIVRATSELVMAAAVVAIWAFRRPNCLYAVAMRRMIRVWRRDRESPLGLAAAQGRNGL